MPELKLTKETFVSVGILVTAIGATAYIVAGATNANAKIDLLTTTSAIGFDRINTRLSKIEANQDTQTRDSAAIVSRIAVLEAEMKRVQSAQSK